MSKEKLTNADVEIVPVKDITIGTRRRKKLTGIPSLASSIKRQGLIHPIVVDADWKLVAGYRRLEAFKHMGRRSIPARFAAMTKDARDGCELDENQQRVPLSQYEASKGRAKEIEDLFKNQSDPGPTHKEVTAVTGQHPAMQLRDKKVLDLGERFPFMQKFSKRQFIEADNVLGKHDEDDEAINTLVVLAGVTSDNKGASELIQNLYQEHSAKDRKRILKDALGKDPAKQERAVTDVFNLPPMPDVRIDPVFKAKQLLTRAIKMTPNDKPVVSPLRTAVASIDEALKLLKEQ